MASSILARKGIILNKTDSNNLDLFVKSNCSHYYMINFLRIANNNINDAIMLYFMDEKLRQIILKYILRLEIQMKKDFLEALEKNSNNSFTWDDVDFYYSKYTQPKGNYSTSEFDRMKKEINDRISMLGFSSNRDKNHSAFYVASFGTFMKIINSVKICYIKSFLDKYMYDTSKSGHLLKGYLNNIRLIRNRCCHSNHLLSIKLKNSLQTNLDCLNEPLLMHHSPFEKTLFFIYSRLDNKDDFKNDLLNCLHEYDCFWKPYCVSHILSPNTITFVSSWK